MTLNSSGAISLGGSTSGQSINLELAKSATSVVSLNDTDVRTLAGKASGSITMPTDFYGKNLGLPFTQRTSGVTTTIRWVKYVNSRFVAGGSTSTPLLYSTNGTSWTVTSTPQTITTDIAYGAGVYVVSASNGLATTTDLNTFVLRQSNPSGTGFQSVEWNGKLFAATTVSGGAGIIYTSPDGITWTPRNTAADTYASSGGIFVKSVDTVNGGLFIASSRKSTSPFYVIQTSTDGINWTIRYSNNNTIGSSGAWVGSKILIPSSTQPLQSTDGFTWSAGTTAPIPNLRYRGTASDGSGRVMFGNNNYTSGNIVVSNNSGSSWSLSSVGNYPWSVAYGNGLFVVVGGDGNIWTTPATF